MNELSFFLAGLIIFVISIVLHEYAHLRALRKFFPQAKINFQLYPPKLEVGQNYMYNALTKSEAKDVYMAGVVVGAIPIFFSFLIINPAFGLLIIPYLFGADKDIVSIVKIYKEKEKWQKTKK